MATYTNLVVLQGWLEIENVSVRLVNRAQVPVLKGWSTPPTRPGWKTASMSATRC